MIKQHNDQVIYAQEHQPFEATDALKDWVIKSIPPDKRNQDKTLGLDFYSDGQLAPGYYVGAVWAGAEGKVALVVSPKKESMDYLAMYHECANDPIVGQHLDQVFRIWPDENPIEAKIDTSVDILIVAIFLHQLNNLCQRHLRQNFIQSEENLSGKMKGKLLMSQHLKQNEQQFRPDRSYCQFQKISMDCRENRILKAALAVALRAIGNERLPFLHEWGRSCLNHLASIPIVKIASRDFLGIRYSGMFSHYKTPHQLAKYVLKKYGADPNSKEIISKCTPPFSIYMPELFERFCEVKLRQESHVWAGYDVYNLGRSSIKVRPDFLCKDSEGNLWIVDAKYRTKQKVEYERAGIDQSNVYQVVAYSRHLGVQERLHAINCGDPFIAPRLAVIYPELKNSNHDKKLLTADWDLPGFDIQFNRIAVQVPSLSS